MIDEIIGWTTSITDLDNGVIVQYIINNLINDYGFDHTYPVTAINIGTNKTFMKRKHGISSDPLK